MKKLLLALCLVSSLAHADAWLEIPTQQGGKILLLSTGCGESSGKMAIATQPGAINVNGCWWYFADMIHVVWSDKRTSSYDLGTVIPKKN